MALRLRVDVDKPYGNHTIIRKIASKIIEESGVPPFSYRHLDYVQEFLAFLSLQEIKATFYFRMCTLPGKGLTENLCNLGHKIGFHAENTESFSSFKNELDSFCKKMEPTKINRFTKHGSGGVKLGRYHYAPYEPDKYRKWASDLGVIFDSGNGILDSTSSRIDNFEDDIFWVEQDYRSPGGSIDFLVNSAVDKVHTVLCHPENFVRNASVRKEFQLLIDAANKSQVKWINS